MFKNLYMQPFYNADGGAGGGATEPTPPTNPDGDETKPPTEGGAKTFTQAELDAIVKERLDREKKKREQAEQKAKEEAERVALEEQGKYKEMYEKLQKDLADKEKAVLDVRKETMLLGAGYTQEQVDRYKKYLTGDTEDDIKQALETLKADIPPTKVVNGVDPATSGNGAKPEQNQKDPVEYGKSVFARLKESGRIR